MWSDFSAWLLFFGLVKGRPGAIAGLVDFLSNRSMRALAPPWFMHNIGNGVVSSWRCSTLSVPPRCLDLFVSRRTDPSALNGPCLLHGMDGGSMVFFVTVGVMIDGIRCV